MTLQRNIFLILVGLLLGALLLIAGVGYFTTRDSVGDLRARIMATKERQVAGELRHYFGQTEPAMQFMQSAVFKDAPAALAGWQGTVAALAEYMRAAPELSFMYYADAASGDLVGVQRDFNGVLVAHHTVSANDRMPETFAIGADGALTPYRSETVTFGRYDPRERPWYKAAVESEGLVWTPPYQFPASDLGGISVTKAKRDTNGQIEGVFAVDLYLGDIAAFLDDLRIGESGAVFILLENGDFLVDRRYRTRPQALQIRDALAAIKPQDRIGQEDGAFECEHCDIDYLVVFEDVPRPGGDNVTVAVAVPTTEFMGVVRRNALLTVLGGIGVVAVAIGISIFFSHRITRPLAEISDELERAGRLELGGGEGELSRARSPILEIARFEDSVGRMKVSLRSFSRYVPRDIVRKLVAQRDEARLGGELREVTVQFSDLAGFTSMSERLDADAVFRELRIFLEALAEAQTAHGGITSNFTGDGTMALFNAPDEHPDHAADAVEAGLEILAKLRAINAERMARGRPELLARIGINTARVLVGNLGTSDRFTYTAVGDGVNIASRIEGLNKLYGTDILVGQACQRRAGAAFEWRRIDQIAVVGRRRGVTIYEPLGRVGEVSDELLERRDRYQHALGSYCKGEFAIAMALFGSLREEGDSAAGVLYDRTVDLLHTEIPENWDGTFAAPYK